MKFRHITYTALLALVSLTSCNSFLDKVPDTRVELKTPEQLRMLLVNGYPAASYSLVGELSSDNVIDNNSPNADGVRYNLNSYGKIDDEMFAWDDAKASNGTDSPSSVWENYYSSIACCNAVLQRIAELEAEGRGDEVKAIKGEALVLRSYDHFILANLFCMPYRGAELSKQYPGIPYVTEPETKVLVQYERGTLDQTYEKIQKDLEEGLPLINDGIYEVPKYHFNKEAANAYAARFYLFIRDYEKVLKYADLALGGEGSDVASYCSDIWNQTSNFSYISDFARYFTNITHKRNFMLLPTYSGFWRHFVSSPRYTPNRDAKRATIQGPGPTWDRWQWTNSKTHETFAMHPAFNGCCGSCSKSEYGTYFAGTCGELFEYTDKVQGIGYTHNVRSEFFGEETIMCRAEAKAFLGDIEGAVADLKAWEETLRNTPNVSANDLKKFSTLTIDVINNFYGANDPGFGIVKKLHIDEVCPSDKYSVNSNIEPLLQCIYHFRRIVTVHNGMRFFDIKRLGLEVTHYIGKDNRKVTLNTLDPRYALQIPYDVIAAGLQGNNRTYVSAADGASKATTEKYELVKK